MSTNVPTSNKKQGFNHEAASTDVNLNTDVLIMAGYTCRIGSTSRMVDTKKAGIPLDGLTTEQRAYIKGAILSKDFFNQLLALDKRVEVYLDSVGKPSFFGQIIQEEKALEVNAKMAEFKAEWYEIKKELRLKYADSQKDALKETAEGLKDWMHLPAFLEAVKSAQEDWDYYEENVQFDYAVVPVGGNLEQYSPTVQEMIRKGLHAIKQGSFGKTLANIVRKANKMLEKIAGKVDQRNHENMRSVAEDLNAMSFIDKRMRVLANGMKQVLAGMPKTGPLKGGLRDDFEALLKAMSDQKQLVYKLDNGLPLIERKQETAEKTAEAQAEAVNTAESEQQQPAAPDTREPEVVATPIESADETSAGMSEASEAEDASSSMEFSDGTPAEEVIEDAQEEVAVPAKPQPLKAPRFPGMA